MNRPLALSLSLMVVATIATPQAFAQRDAAAKARGDMRPFWNARSPRTTYRSAVSLPSIRSEQPVMESYRSFSYVPATPMFKAGDEAVVTGVEAKMMRGSEEVATIPAGTRFTVTKVMDGWLGAVIEMNGNSFNGWIRNTNASAPRSESSATVQNPAEIMQAPAQVQDAQEYRSFSYQPSQVQPQRSQPVKKQPWQYPKGDPHRYHP